MSISQYEALIKAIETGTLSGAAEELGYTQSGITRMLNTLESNFGTKLLRRGRTGVSLTSDGEYLLPYIREALHSQYALDTRVREMNGLNGGLIRIGSFNSVSAQWLPPIIKEFLGEHPGYRFELLNGTNQEIGRWLAEQRIDFGFVKSPFVFNGETEFLYRDPIVSIFAEDDPHAGRESLPVEEILDLPYICLKEGLANDVSAVLKNHGITPTPRFIESDDLGLIAMVEQGLGVGLIPELVLEGFSRRVVTVPLDPPAFRDLGIAYHSGSDLPRSVQAFLDCTRSYIRRHYGSGRDR